MAGCKNIQIDEPLLVRRPDDAKEYGFSILTDILPESVTR